jgi:hypothetical protein
MREPPLTPEQLVSIAEGIEGKSGTLVLHVKDGKVLAGELVFEQKVRLPLRQDGVAR